MCMCSTIKGHISSHCFIPCKSKSIPCSSGSMHKQKWKLNRKSVAAERAQASQRDTGSLNDLIYMYIHVGLVSNDDTRGCVACWLHVDNPRNAKRDSNLSLPSFVAFLCCNARGLHHILNWAIGNQGQVATTAWSIIIIDSNIIDFDSSWVASAVVPVHLDLVHTPVKPLAHEYILQQQQCAMLSYPAALHSPTRGKKR